MPIRSKTCFPYWLRHAFRTSGKSGLSERFNLLVLSLVFGLFVLCTKIHTANSTSSNKQNTGAVEVTRRLAGEKVWSSLDPEKASTVAVAWPENNSYVPSHTKLGTQSVIGLVPDLPPTRVWLKYCLLFYRSNETGDELGDTKQFRPSNTCTSYRESSTPEFNVIVPHQVGRHKLIVHTKICFLENPSKCLFAISPPVFFYAYPSSLWRSFDEIFAGLAKLESPNARELEPRSFQPMRPDGLHNQYDLVLLTPDKTITVFHQVLVKYIFVHKKSRKVVPIMPGKICFTLISDQSHMSNMVACATVPGSSTRVHNDIIQAAGYLPSENFSETSPGGRLLFLWADKEDSGSTFESNVVIDTKSHVFGRTDMDVFKVKPGLVYLMASFYYDPMLQAEHVYSKNIEPIIGEEADLVSPFTTWFFSNSFIYDNSFSPKMVSMLELERTSIIDKHGYVGIGGIFQTRAYMTLVWGDSFVHGVLALAASLKSVGSHFGLVVLIPRSSLSRSSSIKHPSFVEGYMSPSSLALIEASANVQDVIIVDDMGINDCLFGRKLYPNLRDAVCDPRFEEFAYMLTNELEDRGTPTPRDPRVYLKLLAFGLTTYEMIGFIDADSLALKNPDASLLQPNTAFMGVGEGIMPGAYFVLKPSVKHMELMMAILSRTGGRYRFAEMTFLNLYFGSSYDFNNSNVHNRLPEDYLCVVMDTANFDEMRGRCIFVDFASCNFKPWEALGKRRPVAFSGDICPEKPVKGSAWNDAINYWLDVHDNATESSHLFHWSNLPTDESLDAVANVFKHKEFFEIIDPVNNEQIKSSVEFINISISIDFSKILLLDKGKVYCIENARPQRLSVVVCLERSCMTVHFLNGDLCPRLSSEQSSNLKNPNFKQSFTTKFKFPGVGQHGLKAYCFLPGSFESISDKNMDYAMKLKHISKSPYSCGSHQIMVEGISSESNLGFMDAQVYVSGGTHTAVKKWDVSGRAQFTMLLQLGLQPYHRVLEIGCGTFNLGRFLIPYLDAKKYVCVEPNEWLILSSLKLMQNRSEHSLNLILALRKKIQILYRYDFDASSAVLSPDENFDFIYSHSVLSHASRSQLEKYINVSSRLLKPGGLSIASMCLCAPCESVNGKDKYDKHGMKLDPNLENMHTKCSESLDEVWVYPYISWWSPSRLYRIGKKYDMRIAWRNDIREKMINLTGVEVHDWIVMTKG